MLNTTVDRITQINALGLVRFKRQKNIGISKSLELFIEFKL